MGDKIIPKTIKVVEKPGKTPFWAVKCADGRDITVWDGEIALQLEKNLENEIDVEIKSSESNGKTYYNIRAINSIVGAVPQEKVESSNPTITVNPSLDHEDLRGKSIIAQCLVKAVIARSDRPVEVKEAVEMYKLALSLI